MDKRQQSPADKESDSGRARSEAECIIIEAEKFKASLASPKGKDQSEIMDNPADKHGNLNKLIESLDHQLKALRTQVRNNEGKDNGASHDMFVGMNKTMGDSTVLDYDEFFHITCHVDPSLKPKIGRGEFVDLEKLFVKDQFRHRTDDGRLEWYRSKECGTYLAPTERETKINGLRK